MTTTLSLALRRSLLLLVTGLTSLGLSVALAPPASADVAEGWPQAEPVDMLNAVLLLGGVPLLLFVAIMGAIYLPALVRGERLSPVAPTVENQWLGGPRKSAGELAGPDTETSEAGGASGRW